MDQPPLRNPTSPVQEPSDDTDQTSTRMIPPNICNTNTERRQSSRPSPKDLSKNLREFQRMMDCNHGRYSPHHSQPVDKTEHTVPELFEFQLGRRPCINGFKSARLAIRECREIFPCFDIAIKNKKCSFRMLSSRWKLRCTQDDCGREPPMNRRARRT